MESQIKVDEMEQLIKEIPHQPNQPLSIERDWSNGHEVIIIEGVRYDADYFRQFSHPETDVLYAVERMDDFVKLTVIQTAEQAKEFFEKE
jgi:hypothetical protein